MRKQDRVANMQKSHDEHSGERKDSRLDQPKGEQIKGSASESASESGRPTLGPRKLPLPD